MEFNQEKAPNEEDLVSSTYQSIAGEAYARLLELQEDLRYNLTLTEEAKEKMKLEITELSKTIEGSK